MAERKTSRERVEEKVEELKQVVEETAQEEQQVTPKTVKLSHRDPKAEIFYTTDGTYPVPNKAKKYTKPFIVYENTLVKAVAVIGTDVSPVLTKEYKVL